MKLNYRFVFGHSTKNHYINYTLEKYIFYKITYFKRSLNLGDVSGYLEVLYSHSGGQTKTWVLFNYTCIKVIMESKDEMKSEKNEFEIVEDETQVHRTVFILL